MTTSNQTPGLMEKYSFLAAEFRHAERQEKFPLGLCVAAILLASALGYGLIFLGISAFSEIAQRIG